MSNHTADLISDVLSDDTIQRFQKLFNRFCRDLDGALERASEEYQRHMPSKGDVCEAAVCKYLSETLGSRYAIAAKGHVFDSTGTQSAEQDVIIFDDYWSVRLVPRDSCEPPIIPVESVYATIQVKKTLRSGDLRDAVDNLRSFKSLKREIVGPQYVTPNKSIRGLGELSRSSVRNPYFSAVFAFEVDRSMGAVAEQLKREVAGFPATEWPDVVVVHNKGVILPFCSTCNSSGTYIGSIAADGHTPTYLLDELGGSYSILGFHLLLMKHLHYTILRTLDFHKMYARLASVVRLLPHIKKPDELHSGESVSE